MQVNELMTRTIRIANPDDTLQQAALDRCRELTRDLRLDRSPLDRRANPHARLIPPLRATGVSF